MEEYKEAAWQVPKSEDKKIFSPKNGIFLKNERTNRKKAFNDKKKEEEKWVNTHTNKKEEISFSFFIWKSEQEFF